MLAPKSGLREQLHPKSDTVQGKIDSHQLYSKISVKLSTQKSTLRLHVSRVDGHQTLKSNSADSWNQGSVNLQ